MGGNKGAKNNNGGVEKSASASAHGSQNSTGVNGGAVVSKKKVTIRANSNSGKDSSQNGKIAHNKATTNAMQNV